MTHLPKCSQPTTALGFGCATLSGGSSRRHNIRLVHEAYDAGIRHFDVAPPYGMGTAENVLGEALSGRRHGVTLATKVGIAPPRHARAVMQMRSLAAPLRRLAPQLTRRVGASAYSGLTARPKFDAHFVEASLINSLRQLRTDSVDLLLLHEVTPNDLTSELLDLLEKLRGKGLARAIGTGTSYESTVAIRATQPESFHVWQHSWSLLDADRQPPPPDFTVTHGAIQRAFSPLRERLLGDTAEARRLSDLTGIDLTVPDTLGCVLIGAAIAHNQRGITLVSSRQQGRMSVNARVMSDARFVAAGRQLISVLAAERHMVRS